MHLPYNLDMLIEVLLIKKPKTLQPEEKNIIIITREYMALRSWPMFVSSLCQYIYIYIATNTPLLEELVIWIYMQ